ncbi:MAG: ActS/PrrB/RegB family redox-sensitive histidine kinase [Sphingomonadales bacterium]|nr:ActS/PrrB/RegB family redox-sensitive histidine kinase [Sphingomonadales bacterium]
MTSHSARSSQSDAATASEGAGIRLATFIHIRWYAIIGQFGTLSVVRYGFGFAFDPLLPFLAVAASALLNVYLSLAFEKSRQLSPSGATSQLAFDLCQLAFLLYLTGGLENPFAVLILVPVTISASVLDRRSTYLLLALGIVLMTVLAIWHLPLPWGAEPRVVPGLYLAGLWVGMVFSLSFLALYAARVAAEARRRAEALTALRDALTRERHLSSVGALAAATAHQLGTPLGTITLAARELEDAVAEGSELAEDIALINAEAARCRTILAGLAESPWAVRDDLFDRLPVHILVAEAVHSLPEKGGVAVDYCVDEQSTEGPPPIAGRRPEILHGIANLVDNAVKFAASEVVVRLAWDETEIILSITDDGPGFDPEILSSLGEPYVTSKRAGPPSQVGGGSLGLGIFIAKTMLERMGAEVQFSNRRDGGARVTIRWLRKDFESALGPALEEQEQTGQSR